jgi:hypothetical protein
MTDSGAFLALFFAVAAGVGAAFFFIRAVSSGDRAHG